VQPPPEHALQTLLRVGRAAGDGSGQRLGAGIDVQAFRPEEGRLEADARERQQADEPPAAGEEEAQVLRSGGGGWVDGVSGLRGEDGLDPRQRTSVGPLSVDVVAGRA
jgi:hypothetical protein